MRTQKKDTKLFFDSLKHIKNNLSNIIFYEIFTLKDCESLKEYLSIKSVNYKSKTPDMKKFGLIDYNIGSNSYNFTEYGLEVLKILKDVGQSYKNYNHNERLESINYNTIISKIGANKSNELQNVLMKMLFSYFDSADSLRPYYLLCRVLAQYNNKTLNDELFLNILAQTKTDMLNKKDVDNKALIRNYNLREEIARPKSYIADVLKVTGIVDENMLIQLEMSQVEEINKGLIIRNGDDYDTPPAPGRPAEEQAKFREGVLKAYNYKCAITGKGIRIMQKDNSLNYMLDAAHIIPYSEGGSFSISNGIALCREMHRLFDKNLIAFDYNKNNELEVIVTKNDKVFDDGTLAEINHKVITMPDIQFRPSDEALLYRLERLM